MGLAGATAKGGPGPFLWVWWTRWGPSWYCTEEAEAWVQGCRAAWES